MTSSTKCRSTDVAEFVRVLERTPGAVREIRLIDCPSKRGGSFKRTAAGYFIDPRIAAMRVAAMEKNCAPPTVYITINPVKPSLIGRTHHTIEFGAKHTTNDDAITKREWLLLDFDPIRDSGISSTDPEMDAAIELADKVREDLHAEGWPQPVLGMSGNGAYLLYAIDLPNEAESTELVKKLLKGLAARFDTATTKIDTGTFNASRICALLGTWKRKGSHLVGVEGIENRPHRQSWFEPPKTAIDVVPRELLQAIADTPRNAPTYSASGW